MTDIKPIITCESIRSKGPCYDPERHLPADYSASLSSFLVTQIQVPPEDRIWVAVKHMNDRDNRLFAVWCARQSLSKIKNPDPRSIAACDVAERFAMGNATADELSTAWYAARSAAWCAARYAAGYAAGYAAEYAAGSAAEYAAEYAAWCAAARQEQCEWLSAYLIDVYGE